MSHAQVILEIGTLLAQEVETDYVGLWAILWEVKQRLPSLSPAEARSIVLAIVREAIERNVVVPGEFVEMHFTPWKLSPMEALERIESTWCALDREPDVGEVVWFVAKPRPN